jgi:hypothetical protein
MKFPAICLHPSIGPQADRRNDARDPNEPGSIRRLVVAGAGDVQPGLASAGATRYDERKGAQKAAEGVKG